MTYLYGVFWFANRIFSQKNFIDTFHRSHTLRDGVSCAGQIFERLNHTIKNHHVEDEGGRIDGTVVSKNQRTAIPKHQDNEAGAQKFAHGVCRTLTNRHA